MAAGRSRGQDTAQSLDRTRTGTSRVGLVAPDRFAHDDRSMCLDQLQPLCGARTRRARSHEAEAAPGARSVLGELVAHPRTPPSAVGRAEATAHSDRPIPPAVRLGRLRSGPARPRVLASRRVRRLCCPSPLRAETASPRTSSKRGREAAIDGSHGELAGVPRCGQALLPVCPHPICNDSKR